MKILVIEDEIKVGAFIKRGLEEHHHQVEVFTDGLAGQQAALEQDYDLILLDLMLPGINGTTVCKNLRTLEVSTPILMLTALNATQDIVEGLNAGADDYLAKPFHFSELIARVNALSRRKSHFHQEQSILTFADLQLNTNTKTANREGQEIVLTAKEYALLELLLRNTGKVLSRALISEAVWGLEFDTGTNTIDVYVNYLRNKIEKGFTGEKLIHTVVGMGYVMKQK
ncbi:response regulator transcription factor [Chitinophaga arvensicola]|uniref:DNA-binding response regulator, OmpR family, contains REC and winged-helix (WHTH) domain n=1 Tax=Chitinophaga arvensicola TaxID=29529 RepID=A0A1I0SDU7_9BACT|nr:response regulator transcription factor [Chitinophaga arvensicola]SEW57288.1 DNA-binding response regulator, OmpR family, contains REC and winged-helix (wHTH) domain [Chitinophaga arvensicola]